jgi:hypothetical protein
MYQSKPERESDHGHRASGWRPGDQDQNTAVVIAESDPKRPGIAIESAITVIAGLRVGPDLLVKLLDAGIIPDENLM